MDDSALGAIETFGFIPAIEAADTAVKSADVILTGCRYAGAGLVTVMLSGDISAVKASVEAGEAAAKRLGPVVSTTVIGRKARGLDAIFRKSEEQDPLCAKTEPKIEPGTKPEPEPELPARDACGETTDQETDPSLPVPSEKTLRKMKVTRLRALARSLGEAFSMERQKIKFARKQELIRAILAYYRQI